LEEYWGEYWGEYYGDNKGEGRMMINPEVVKGIIALICLMTLIFFIAVTWAKQEKEEDEKEVEKDGMVQ